MFTSNFELVKDTHPGAVGIHYKSKTKCDFKTNLQGLPSQQLVSLYTQLGTLQGLLETFGRCYFNGAVSISIENGKTEIQGEATFYQRAEGDRASSLLNQIDGVAFTISRGYLGKYKASFNLKQVCEVNPQ